MMHQMLIKTLATKIGFDRWTDTNYLNVDKTQAAVSPDLDTDCMNPSN